MCKLILNYVKFINGVTNRCVLPGIVADDPGSSGMLPRPRSDVVHLVVDDDPLVVTVRMFLHFRPRDGARDPSVTHFHCAPYFHMKLQEKVFLLSHSLI